MNAEDESRMSPDQGESLHDDHPIATRGIVISDTSVVNVAPDTFKCNADDGSRRYYFSKCSRLQKITVTADAAYQGASGGVPRNVDKPANRIEDIHGMADFISQYLTFCVISPGLRVLLENPRTPKCGCEW